MTLNPKIPPKVKETYLKAIFFNMRGQDPRIRRTSTFLNHLRNIPHIDDQEFVHWLKCLWKISMIDPSIHFPTCGIFQCMAGLILKCLKNKSWLLKNQNIYIPYYAAHIIGSLTINHSKSAQEAVDAGVIPPLLELLRGKMSWVEQRVAVRALGHLASYEKTFLALANTYEEEIVILSIHLASTCADVVYKNFVGVKDQNKLLKYHKDLLAKGFGDFDVENQKAEEWASQIQCWCIHLLNCFATKKRSLHLICKEDFLNELCIMYGRWSTNRKSPAGIGLIRILCHIGIGRKIIAECESVMLSLCNLSRSSDDWQYMGIDCLLLLVKDPGTRYKVIEIAIFCLKDLIELRNISVRSHVGDMIIKTIFTYLNLRDDKKIKNTKVQEILVEMLNFKINKGSDKESKMAVLEIKEKGNSFFQLGKIEEAMLKYSEGLEKCPIGLKKERMVIYSKRAHCHMLLRDYDAAISDTTRALSICDPPNSHCKSLWRRAVAYDMKGLAKESLMDCIMFVTWYFKSKRKRCNKIVPYYVMRMICKQMEATWLFKSAQLKDLNMSGNHSEIQGKDRSGMSGLPTILEEPLFGHGGKQQKES